MEASTEESRLLEALRRGDEEAFSTLLDRHHGSLLRLAMNFVQGRDVAEEVVQETWRGVLEGLDRFEGRSSLKTWIFRILVNRAKSRGVRESRTVPFSSLAGSGEGDEEPAVNPERFFNQGPRAGHWIAPPHSWDAETPERLLLSKESREYIERAIAALPDGQRVVILMRDVEGIDSGEVCNILGISETNQRVLLHRARSKVRRELERYLRGEYPGR
ncbi:MAG: sigma-70 family RNA polymerase sigma factor [Nitrospirae bacterium]|nr:sigma-70 family RNA polymerase sigma factor [Nitrospirota bacterium]